LQVSGADHNDTFIENTIKMSQYSGSARVYSKSKFTTTIHDARCKYDRNWVLQHWQFHDNQLYWRRWPKTKNTTRRRRMQSL